MVLRMPLLLRLDLGWVVVGMELMHREMFMDSTNNCVAPLPFRFPQQRLPNNREQALTRLTSLCRTLEREPEMLIHFLAFIQKISDNDQAELAPPLSAEEEQWYLPIFGVHHPHKPNQIRLSLILVPNIMASP